MRIALINLLVALPLFALSQDYSAADFDITEYELKTWESRSLLRGSIVHNESARDTFSEVELNSNNHFRKGILNLETEVSAQHSEKNQTNPANSYLVLNRFVQTFTNEEKTFEIGKSVKRWGKGYAFNSVGFFEREKDVFFPELNREGFWLIEGTTLNILPLSWTESSSLTLLLAPETESNEDLYLTPRRLGAAKLYALIGESDFDIIVGQNFSGFDFSTNLTLQVEFHLEAGKIEDDESYLFGFRFQSTTDFSFIGEYFSDYLNKKYVYYKLSQKEPLSILYLTVYAIYIQSQDVDFYRSLAGMTYNFYGKFDLDVGIQKSTKDTGLKLIGTYYF